MNCSSVCYEIYEFNRVLMFGKKIIKTKRQGKKKWKMKPFWMNKQQWEWNSIENKIQVLLKNKVSLKKTWGGGGDFSFVKMNIYSFM